MIKKPQFARDWAKGGGEVTGEDLSKLVSLLKEGLQRVHKETAWNNSNRTWTRKLKSALAELASDQRVPSAPPGQRRSVWASGTCNAREEWLYDLCWLDYEDGFLIGMPLAVESEWGRPGDIFDDFQKLVQSRASVRLMIYDAGYPRQDEMVRSLSDQILKFAHSNSNDRYLLAAFSREKVDFVSLDGEGNHLS